MKRTADIQDFLQPLRDKPYQAYFSNALQVADVLEWTLQQLGKSEVLQTILDQRGVHPKTVLHREVGSRHPLQPGARPQGHQQNTETVGVHHTGHQHHLSCRQPQQDSARAQPQGRGRLHRDLAEPHARQPL